MRILKLFSRPVAFHRCLAELCGSALAGLFLSQAIYWTDRTKDPEGWFYKTQDEWYKEIFLSRYEQEAVRRKLKALGYLEEKKVGLPAKLYFRVNVELLEAELLESNIFPLEEKDVATDKSAGIPTDKSAGIPQTGMVGYPRHSIYTENTSEITYISGESQSDSPLVAEGKILLEFPCREKKQVWHLTERVLEELQEVYPEIDCLAEAKRAKLWVESNPTRKKTKRGYQRFLLNWIASARNPASRTAAAPPPAQVNWETHPRKAELVNLYETHGPLMLSRSQFDLTDDELNLRRAFLTWYTSHE